MSLFGSKKVTSYTLSIALKSSSIDVQLISNPLVGPKEVIYVQRKIILLNDSQDPQLYTKQCISELSILLQKSAKDIHVLSGGSISKTHIILYSPWFTSHITPILHKESIAVTEKFLDQQLHAVETPQNLVNLEKKVIKLLTNGYSINKFTKSKLNNISIEVYSSYILETIFQLFNETIKKAIPISRHISYITSPLLFFDQIKKFLVREDNVSFLYIGGEITEVGIIEDDALSFYATFPIGKHDFLREVQVNNMSYDYDLLYQKQIVIKSQEKQKQFDELKEKWGEMVLSTLLSFKKDVPSKILIISDSKTKNFFTENLISQIKKTSSSSFGQYRIINFEISHLKDIILYKTPAYMNEPDLQLEALI